MDQVCLGLELLALQDPLEYLDPLVYLDLGKLALLSDLLLALLLDLEYLDLGYLDLLVYQDLAYLALENLDRLHQGYL